MKPIPLRLAPILVVAAVPLLGLKLIDIAAHLAGRAVAPAEAAPNPEASPPVPTGVAPGSPKPAPEAGKPAPAGGKPPAPSGSLPPADGKPSPGTPSPTPVSGTPASDAKPGGPGGASDPTSFSPSEVNLLQELSHRRGELDKRAEELDGREMLLKAAEQRIADKIVALQQMEKKINDLLQKKDEENDAKIKSIVRIYEIMKPQEAARVFEQLDMPVLLEVVEHMNERKAAPILASMQPQKAKALTLALAERRQTPKP